MNSGRVTHQMPESMLGGVYSREQLAILGFNRWAVEGLAAAGGLRPMRRGWYWVPPRGPIYPEQLHCALIAASVGAAGDDGRQLVLAGASAAMWWKLPWVGPELQEVVTCRPAPGDAGRSPRARVRRLAGPPADQLTVHRGVPITSVARTVLDVARTCHPRVALAVADAALHLHLTDPSELGRVLVDLRHRTGAEAARWCVAHADGRTESPGESVSRYEMLAARVPVPELQVELCLPSGAVARVDCYWRAERLIGEFDGLVKYRPERPGLDPQDVVIAEKLREDALRSMGHRVFRWTWQDLRNPASWLSRLRTLLLTP